MALIVTKLKRLPKIAGCYITMKLPFLAQIQNLDNIYLCHIVIIYFPK